VPPAVGGSAEKNPWLDRRVLAYAHQGGAWEAPSSTLYAIRRAVGLGATGIELDVHATADGHLVVCHDATVDRTTDGTGAIAELTLDQVRRLDNAYWFVPGADVTPGLAPEAYELRGRAPDDRELGVATLDEVLDVLDTHPSVVVNLDIKQTTPAVAPYEAALATVLARHDVDGRVIVASFLDQATEAFAAAAPDVPTSAGTLSTALFIRAVRNGEPVPAMAHVALQVPRTHGDIVVVDEDTVAAAHGAGLAVHVWTINDRPTMEALLDLGVDGIITDLPGTLVPLLEERGLTARV
jgi:glycerophosphoryl diester phosphodiesterase